MTVYLDIIFWENTLMNYIILITTGFVCKQKIQQIRLIISSMIGSLYAVTYYITEIKIYEMLWAKIILSIIMIHIAFNCKNLKKILKELIIFYLTSFAFGGCAFAIIYYIKPENILYSGKNLIGTYPIKIAVLGRNNKFFNNKYGFQISEK